MSYVSFKADWEYDPHAQIKNKNVMVDEEQLHNNNNAPEDDPSPVVPEDLADDPSPIVPCCFCQWSAR